MGNKKQGKFFRFIFLFCLAVVFFSVSFPQAPLYSQEPPKATLQKAEDFYPLRPGNFWTYQVEVEEQMESGKKTRIVKYKAGYVLKVLSVENKVTHKEVILKKEWATERRPAGELDAEITYHLKGLEIIQVSGDTKEVRYRFPLFVGARWGDPRQVDRIDLSYFYSLEKQEDVAVPAGKFPESYWIIYRTRPDHTIEWFYPGVGVVKREYHHHGTVLNTVESLVQYKAK